MTWARPDFMDWIEFSDNTAYLKEGTPDKIRREFNRFQAYCERQNEINNQDPCSGINSMMSSTLHSK